MNKTAFGTAFAVLATMIPAVAPAQQRTPAAVIVVVNRAQIIRDCNACRTAQQQLQAQATSLQQYEQQLGAPLQTEGQSLQTAINALQGKAPDANLQARITAFQNKQNQAQQQLQTRAQQLRSTQANVVQQIDQKMSPAIQQIMTAHGANLAVDEDATLAHTTGLDVSNEVLAALNPTLTTISVTPLPAQQQQPQQPQGR